MPYLRIFQDYLLDVNISKAPVLDSKISFIRGMAITEPLPTPLIFELSAPPDQQPGHVLDGVIPVVSKQFVDALSKAGLDNFQIFPAKLVDPDDGREWLDYFAFNVIGLVDSMDMNRSSSDTIMPEGALPGLVDFEKPVLDPQKASGLLMFRELREPSMLIVHSSVRAVLRENKPETGWGFMTSAIETNEVP